MSKEIILISGKAGVGKTTTARMITDVLHNDKCLYIPFAFYLKQISRNTFGWDGKKDELGRGLLINLARVIRDFNINFWVGWVIQQIECSDVDVVIIDDWRYLNEIDEMINKFGRDHIYAVRVERPDGEALKGTKSYNDPSETSLPDGYVHPEFYDMVFDNDGTLDDLRSKINSVFNWLPLS